MFQIYVSHSLPKLQLLLLDVSLPDLILFSLSTAVAVLVSAVGFSRIRNNGSKLDLAARITFQNTLEHVKTNTVQPPRPTTKTTATTIKATTDCHVEEMGTPKARFTACYSAADNCHMDDDVEEDVERECERYYHRAAAAATATGVLWLELEELVTVRRRRGDLGWYRYQDRTAINGSVVRLWG